MKASSEFTFDAATGEPAPPTKVIPNTEARHDVQELLDAYNATIRGQGAELERLRHQLAEAHKEIERLRVTSRETSPGNAGSRKPALP